MPRCLRILFVSLAIAIVGVLFLGSRPAPASILPAPLCEVIRVNHSAWVVRGDQTVVASLKPGDLIRRGDRLKVMAGDSADIAFDSARLNVLHFEGPTEMVIENLFPTRIKLTSGKTFVFLENFRADQRFKIKTKTAVAVPMGTSQSQVNFSDRNGTDVMTYKGAVIVKGIDPRSGIETDDYLILRQGQKTHIQTAGHPPQALGRLEAEDLTAVAKIRSSVVKAIKTWTGGNRANPFQKTTAGSSSILVGKEQGKKDTAYPAPRTPKKGASVLV